MFESSVFIVNLQECTYYLPLVLGSGMTLYTTYDFICLQANHLNQLGYAIIIK